MSALATWEPATARQVEVRVYRYGTLKVCEWCTSTEDARQIVAMWNQQGAMRCEVVSVAS